MFGNSDSKYEMLVIGDADDNERVVNYCENDQSEREWFGQISALLHEHYFAGNILKVNEVLDRFKGRLKADISDPELGNIETSTSRGVLKLAEYCCDQLEFTKCLDICEDVYQVLIAKKARYAAQGLSPDHDSTPWLSLITTLAECKWKNPDHCRDSVMSLEEMIQKYKRLELHIRQQLQNLYTLDTREATNYLVGLSWCGTFMLSTMSRYFPAKYSELREFINSLHDGLLDDTSKPHFWHLSISSELTSSDPSRKTIMNGYFQLRNSVKDYYEPDYNFVAFQISSTIEQRFICRQLFQF